MICADDYGMSPTINKAILSLIEHSKIDQVSVLINKCTKEDIQKIKEKKSNILIGLHLDIFENKFFKFVFILIFMPIRIQNKITEQIDLFYNLFGFYPNYIDGHQHCHIYPILRKLLIKTIISKRINLSFIRSVHIHKSLYTQKICLKNKLYMKWLNFNNTAFIKLLKIHNLKSNSFIFGAFNSHSHFYEIFFMYKSFGDNSKDLIFCHPELQIAHNQKDKTTEQRNKEYEFIFQI